MELEHIKYLDPGYKDKTQIALMAHDFLRKYHKEYDFRIDPIVPIEEIIEIKLKLQTVPYTGLKAKYGIEGFLSYGSTREKTWIYYDEGYNKPGAIVSRFRFTLCHELAHWYLHADIYKNLASSNLEEAFTKCMSLSDSAKKSMDIQASIFSNYLLMPPMALQSIFSALATKHKAKIPEFNEKELDPNARVEIALDFFSKPIAREFDVSKAAARSALRIDGLVSNLFDYR